MSTIPHSNMGQFFDEIDAELIRQFKAITPEQRSEEDRLRQIQRDWEAAHTAFETDEDRADPEKYPQDEDHG